jgi:hypothetical protein
MWHGLPAHAITAKPALSEVEWDGRATNWLRFGFVSLSNPPRAGLRAKLQKSGFCHNLFFLKNLCTFFYSVFCIPYSEFCLLNWVRFAFFAENFVRNPS